MKKIITLVLILCLGLAGICCLAACGDDGPDLSDPKSSGTTTSSTTKIDYDIAALKNAYTITNNILANPDDYSGKTIRIKGSFSQGVITGGTTNHYFVDVYDTAACCGAWVTFSWNGSLPSSGSTVTVTGKVHTIRDGSMKVPEIVAESVTF